jgi:hypothetical protein
MFAIIGLETYVFQPPFAGKGKNWNGDVNISFRVVKRGGNIIGPLQRSCKYLPLFPLWRNEMPSHQRRLGTTYVPPPGLKVSCFVISRPVGNRFFARTRRPGK